jgi:hypothetical protein
VALVPSTAVGDAVLSAWKADGFDGFVTCVAQEARSEKTKLAEPRPPESGEAAP